VPSLRSVCLHAESAMLMRLLRAPLTTCCVLCQADASESDVSEGQRVAAGVNLCKDLVNAPPNFLTPQSMAETAVAIAKEHGMKCEILEEADVRAYYYTILSPRSIQS
jgi:leucyl aminopeptidase